METMHEITETPDGKLQIECTQKENLSEIKALLTEIHKHLFVGNGQSSIMVRLDRSERIISAIIVTIGTVVVAAILSLCGIAFWHLFKAN